MTNLQVISKSSHKIIDNINSDSVNVNQNSVVRVNVKYEDVASISRSGNSAIITLKDGEKIVIENFYNVSTPDNSLVFINNQHDFLVIEHSAQGIINYEPLSSIQTLLYDSATVTAMGGSISLPLLVGSAGLVVGGIAVAAGSNNESSKNNTINSPLTNISANNDGTITVSGRAEPGSTVTVTYPDGSKGTAVAGSDGSYSTTSSSPQSSGNVSAVVTDKNGQTSAATNSSYQDT
ncbi:BapA/Bap/LapF family prefix-like domain-containing protein, partial [Acinetobacter nectaris]|uniref:BapA/Bap/LapF family prefix-like domain-containing protein n=1 Tax=Acinetobacter nectaris TaxID=1219382 RepID=UPI001F44D43A